MEISSSMDFADPQDPKPTPQPFAPQPVPVTEQPAVAPQEPLPITQLFTTEQLGSALAQQYTAQFDAERNMVMQGFRQAMQTNPDAYAKQQKLAAQLGLDPNDQNRDWEFVEKFAQQQAAEQEAFNQQYPILAASMRQFDFAAVSHDDLQALQKIEGLWDFMGAKWELGTLMVERGEIGSKMAAGWADEEDLKRLKEIDRQMQSVPQPSGVLQSLLGGTSEVLGQMIKTVPTSIVAGEATSRLGTLGGPLAKLGTFAVGFGTAQFAQSAIIEGGNAYADYIEQGYSEESARTAAFGVGILNGALETAGLKFASAPLRKVFTKQVAEGFADRAGQSAFWNAVKGYGKAIGGEVATEMAQEISTITGGELAKLYSRPELDSKFGSMRGIGEITTQVMEIAQKTLESMILLGAPGSVGVYMSDSKRIDQAKATHEVLSATVKGAVESKLLDRAPGALKSLLDNTIGPSMPDLYIEGADMKALLDRHAKAQTEAGNSHQKSALSQMEELFPGFTQRMEESIANGTPMKFQTSEIATKLGKSDFIQELLLDMRGDPNGLSQREAAKWYPELQNISGQMQEAISQKAIDDKAFRDSMRKVRDEMLVNVRGQGVQDAQARVAVNLYTARVALAATRDNVSPEEYHRKHGVRTQAAAQPALRPVPMTPTMERILSPVVPKPAPAATAPAAPAPAPSAPVAAAAPSAAPAQAAIAPSRYDDAVNLVLGQRKASPEFLQRNMAVSYTEAEQLLAQMEADQLIGEAAGPRRARQVIMSLAQYRRMRPVQSAPAPQAPVAQPAPAPAEAVAPEVAPAPAPAEAAAPTMTPEQEAQRMQLATAYAELFDPASTMTNEQKVTMVEELLTDPRLQLTEEEQAPLKQWLAEAQQVIAPPLPVAEDPTLPTPQEVGQMVEEIVQLEQQIQQAEAQPEAVVEPVAEAQPVAEAAPAAEPVAVPEPQASTPTSLSLFKDGIEGVEVSYQQVPFGNAAFEYAVGKVEEGGAVGIFRRSASERGTYGGWRWEANADRLSPVAKPAPIEQPEVAAPAEAAPAPAPAQPQLAPVSIKSSGDNQRAAWVSIIDNLTRQWDSDGRDEETGVSAKQAEELANFINAQIPTTGDFVVRIDKFHNAVEAAASDEAGYIDLEETKYLERGEEIPKGSVIRERARQKYLEKIAKEVMEPPAAVKPGRAKKQKQQLEQQLQAVVAPEGITELKDGARALAAGRITRDQWDALVNKLGKVRMVQAVPELSQMDAIRSAMPKGKKEKVMAPEAVPEGTYVGLRLDIPAKTRHGIDVVTVHKAGGGATAGAVIGFTNAAVVTDVEFAAREELVFRIAQELENKDIAAIVKGRMKAMSPEDARALAQQAMTDSQWRQVGFNPKLHSYFFDRATGEPLASAEMVVQIGSLVLAKNAVTAPREQFLFSRMPTTAAKLDAEYLAAVERGDMETAQRMVDEAAKTAGFTTKLWHGTTATVDVATGSTPADAQARKELNALVELLRAAGVYVGSDLSEVGYWIDRFIDEQPAKAAVVGITKSDSAKARSLVKASVGRRAVPEQKMSFDVFNFDTNNEFGPHFGTKQQAETFGNAFPFYVKISRALRLKDLGTWQAVKVLSAAKKAKVSISDSEMESVLALWDAPQDPSTPTESKADVAVRNLLQSKGYDAIVYKNTAEGEGDSYIAFAPSQIKSADPVTRDASGNVIPLSQRFDLTKDSILFSRQSEGDIGGRYDRQQRTIELTAAVLQNPDATFTTWVHELMHWMFDDLSAAVVDGRATQQDREQLETMVRWASKGKMSADEFLALPPEQQREIHETVAYGWEAYHFEGADPGVEYRGMMRKIRDWFIAAYKSLTTINDRYKRETGQDLPGLTPEVKVAFSRFIGTENQVQMAKASRSAVAMFQTKDEFIAAGNREDEWDEYQTLQRERDQQWIDELLSESIQQLKWQATSRDRNIKRLQQDTEGVREELRKEIRPTVQAMPIMRARRFLLTGEKRNENGVVTDGAGTTPHHKLNRNQVLGDYDAENAVLGELDAKVMEAKSAVAQAEGMHIPVVPEFEEEPPTKLPETATKDEKKAYRAALSAYNDRRREAMVLKKEAQDARREALAKQDEALRPALEQLKKAEAAVKEAEARFKRKENARAEDHPLGKYTEQDGMDVGETAKNFGYNSTADFLSDLQKKPSEDEMVEMLVSRRLQEDYGDLTNKQAMEESVDRAMVNAFQIRWASRELQFLLRRSRTANNTPEGMARQKDAKDALIDLDNEIQQMRAARKAAKDNGDEQLVQRYDRDIAELERDRKDLEIEKEGTLGQRILIHAARMAAQQTLDNTKIKDIRPSLYAAAARRNSQDALAGVTKAKWQDALDAKRKQMGNEAKAYEAARIQMEVRSALRFFKRVLKSNDSKLGDKRNLDFVYAARAVLLAFKVTSTTVQAARIKAQFDSYMTKLEAYLPDEALKIKELIAMATAEGKSYKDLTYQEFRRLNQEVRKLWDHSQNVVSVEINNKRHKVSEIRDMVAERAGKLAPTGDRPGTRKAITMMESLGAKLNNMLAMMRRAESIFDEWDGKTPGVFTKMFWRPIQQSVTAYRKARIAYYQKYALLVANMTWDTTPINAPEIKYEFKNKAELVAALLHTGNISNLAKLLRGGRGPNDAWGEVLDDNTLDPSRWEAMVDRLCEEGRITEQDLNFVQSVWDLMDELKPQMQLAHRRLEGTFFNEQVLRARTYTLKDGTKKTLRGGYVPAKPDRELAIDYAKKATVEEVMQDFRYSLPRTEMGMTKDRVEGFNKPLQLDLAIIGRHIDDATKFIHVQPAIANILSLLNDQGILTSINEIDGAALNNIIMPWLNRVASQRPGIPGMDSTLDKILNGGRNRAGMAIMFLNLSNTFQQFTGIIPAAIKVPRSYLLGSLRRYISKQGREDMKAIIAEKSAYMANRMDKQIFEVITETNDIIVNPSKYQKAQRWAQKNAYILQQKAQNLIDVIVWDGAYNHAIATLPKTLTGQELETEAVAMADAAVRLTQGTTQPESVSQVEAGTPFVRLFTQFTSYFNTIANLNITEFRKISNELGAGNAKGKLFFTWLIGFAAPMLAASAIARGMAGKWDDEDDDGYGDEISNWLIDGVVKGSFQMVPFGNVLYSATIAPFTDTVYDDRMLSNPAVNILERGIGAVKASALAAVSSERDLRSSSVKDMILLSDIMTGIPVTPLFRQISYGYGVMQDQIDPYNVADLARGLVTGIPAEGTRNR